MVWMPKSAEPVDDWMPKSAVAIEEAPTTPQIAPEPAQAVTPTITPVQDLAGPPAPQVTLPALQKPVLPGPQLPSGTPRDVRPEVLPTYEPPADPTGLAPYQPERPTITRPPTPEEAQQRVSGNRLSDIVLRSSDKFYNDIVLNTVEAWRPSSLYKKGQAINAAYAREERLLGGRWEDLPPAEKITKAPAYIWANLKAMYGNQSRAEQAIRKAKLTGERGSYKIELPPPKGVEKGTDIAVGLAAFITKIWFLKKVGTGSGIIPKGSITGDMAVWEAIGLAEQDIPGTQAAIRGGLGLIGKIPTGSVTGKTAKVLAESGLFAGSTAAMGGSKEDIIISALLPVAFNGWHFAKQKKYLIDYERSLQVAAKTAYQNRIKQGMSQQVSGSHLKADIRIIENSVARAKQKIYSDDAFAPTADKWEIQRQQALKMVRSGNPNKRRIGNDILNFMGKQRGVQPPTIETQIQEARQVGKQIAGEKFVIPTPAERKVTPTVPYDIIAKGVKPVTPPAQAPVQPVEGLAGIAEQVPEVTPSPIEEAVTPKVAPKPAKPVAAKQEGVPSQAEFFKTNKGPLAFVDHQALVRDSVQSGIIPYEGWESDYKDLADAFEQHRAIQEIRGKPVPELQSAKPLEAKQEAVGKVDLKRWRQQLKDVDLTDPDVKAIIKDVDAAFLSKDLSKFPDLRKRAAQLLSKTAGNEGLYNAINVLEGDLEASLVQPTQQEAVGKDLSALEAEAKEQGVKLISTNLAAIEENAINIDRLEVLDETKRGKGTGTAFLKKVFDIADKHGMNVTGSPTLEFGEEKRVQITEFLKKQGFIENPNKKGEVLIRLAQPIPTEPKAVKGAKVVKVEPKIKEIKHEQEAIIELAPSPEVEQRKAGRPVSEIKPTGALDPTDQGQALEITKLHADWVDRGSKFDTRNAWEGIRTTKVVGTKTVTTAVEYTPEQIDTAYRAVQKSIPSPQEDVSLFAMPGQEAKLLAIAEKMRKQKAPKKGRKEAKLAKPKALPKAKDTKEDHIKAVRVASAVESTRYSLTGVYVDGNKIIATDGRRMFIAEGTWGKDGVYLNVTKEGKLGKKAKDVNFPKYQDIIPKVSTRDAIIVKDIDLLWQRVQRAILLTTEESKGLVILANKDGSLGFASSSPEVGHAEINVHPGAKILTGVNPQYLLDSISFHAKRGNKAIEFYFQESSERPILTRSEDGETSTVIMPVNIDITDAEKRISEGFVTKPPPKKTGLAAIAEEVPKKAVEKVAKPVAKKKVAEVKKGFIADPTVEVEAKGEPAFVGVPGRPGGRAKKPWLTSEKTKSPNKDVESFFGRTKRLPYSRKASSLITKIKAGLRERFVTMTPHIENIPKTAIYRDMIRTIPEEARQAGQKAVTDIISVLDNDGTVQALDSSGLDLLRRKVFVQDILHEAEISRSVSGGFKIETLEAENKRLDELIAKVPSVKRAYEARQKLWSDVSQDLLKRGVLDEETAKNKHYVRHFVLDLAEKNYPTGFKRKRLSAPYRAYAKQRKGSVKDISTDYLEVEVRALAQIYKDNAIEDVANKISELANKRKEYTDEARKENIDNAGKPPSDIKGFGIDKWLKEQLGGRFISPEKMAQKDGYVEWHYKRPNLFYRAHTLTEAQIASLVESSAEQAGTMLHIPKEIMREALVLGRRKGMIIPDWLAKQLDDLPVNKRDNYVVRSFTKPFVQFWKRWILRVNPIRYNARNQLGDTERLSASGQTQAVIDIPEAVKVLVTKTGTEYELMKKYGVAGSSLWHEMNDVSTIKEFEKFKDYSKQKTFISVAKKALTLPLRTASKIGSVEQNLTQLREDILRAAVFISNYRKLQAGKPVRHWAGDVADINEIAKIDKARAAAKISRETLGDYGAFTPFETNVLRQGMIPFYSWMKINTVFWPRVLKNAAKDGTVGKPLAASATLVGINLAKWLVRVLWAYAAAYLWNNRDDEARKKDKSIPFWVRAMPHINIDKFTLWGQTALSDFVEWFDMEKLLAAKWRHDAGFLTQKEASLEVARSIAQAPVNKLYQSLNPFVKAPLTAITGQETWPSVFEPRFIASPASKKSFERAVLGILGADAKKFYQTAKGDRKLEDTLYAYFAGWWARPTDPETLAEEIKRTKEWTSLKRNSKVTGRVAGEAKKGKEERWQEAEIRRMELDIKKGQVSRKILGGKKLGKKLGKK